MNPLNARTSMVETVGNGRYELTISFRSAEDLWAASDFIRLPETMRSMTPDESRGYRKFIDEHFDAGAAQETGTALPRMIYDSCGVNQGGLWKCDLCDASYCAPPWTRETAAKDHATKCPKMNR